MMQFPVQDPSRTPLSVAPGFFTESTDKDASARWKDGDKVRFENGVPRKLAGWAAQSLALLGTLKGKIRAVHEWTSLDGVNWIAAATNAKLYLIQNGNALYDITPIRLTASLTNPFRTTSGSAVVSVDHVNHGAAPGDYVRFSGFSAVGGLTLNGEYQVVSVTNLDRYTITAASNASSTVAGGGSTGTAEYDIGAGGDDSTIAYGWGTCTWGNSTWGTPRGACSTTRRDLRVWSMDNWGEDLLAAPRKGALYWWDRSLGPDTRARLVPEAPAQIGSLLVSPFGRQLILLGCSNTAGDYDPLLIRVSNNEDFTDYQVREDNNATSKRIDEGSKIIGGRKTRTGVVVYTNSSTHILLPDSVEVYQPDKLGSGNALCGPKASIDVNGVMFSMGDHDFFMFDGTLRPIPCEVWSRVFRDFNRTQKEKVYCGANVRHREVWWFYPSAAATENDRYVVFNYGQGIWYFGSIARTAWLDNCDSFGQQPIGFEPSGANTLLMKHEQGVDANGAAMSAYIESWDAMLGSGDDQYSVMGIVPDTKEMVGDVTVTIKGKRDPKDATYRQKAYTITPTTERRGTRLKSRQIAIRIASNAIGSDWKLGTFIAELVNESEA